MLSTRCLGASVPSAARTRFHATVRPTQRVALHSNWRRNSSLADNAPNPDDESGDTSLSPEDVDVVVNFYTRRLSEMKQQEAEAAAVGEAAASALGVGAGKSESPTQQPPATIDPTPSPAPTAAAENQQKKLEKPPSSAASLLPPNAESRQEHNKQHNHRILELQEQLLALLATLDRGLAARGDDVIRVENLVLQLESIGEPVILDFTATSSKNKGKSGMELLDGRWRLAYSSGFSGGNLGGRRPGPPAALVPLTLGAVYQEIFVSAKELDNVVTLTAKLSLASLPFLQAEPPAVTARLKHSFSIEGAATVRIVFENTVAKVSGGIGGWLDSLPQFATPMLPESLRPITAPARDATFEVSFLDERMRITRGDRGEVRVFVKES